MNLTEIRQAKLPRRRRRRVGRGPGSGHGKFCGRGMSGFRARSGAVLKSTYEGGQMPLFRRLPKRGFSNARYRARYAVLNVRDLAGLEPGSVADEAFLRRRGILHRRGEGLKVLGLGEISVPVTVKCRAISREAREKIVRAGGAVELLLPAKRRPKGVKKTSPKRPRKLKKAQAKAPRET